MAARLRSSTRAKVVTSISATAGATAVALTPSSASALSPQPGANANAYAAAPSQAPALIASGAGWSIYEDSGSLGTAPSGMKPMSTQINCGYISCTLYVSKSDTSSIDSQMARWANASNAAIAGAFALACLPLDPVPRWCAGLPVLYTGVMQSISSIMQHNTMNA